MTTVYSACTHAFSAGFWTNVAPRCNVKCVINVPVTIHSLTYHFKTATRRQDE